MDIRHCRAEVPFTIGGPPPQICMTSAQDVARAVVSALDLISWPKIFKLRGDRFPGMLGPLGRFLFTKAFLDRSYAAFMKSAMKAMERYALQAEEDGK